MALSDVTVSFNVHDLFGNDFDTRRAKAWATNNADDQTLHDTDTGETRIGSARATIGSDGTGTFIHWAPGADGNPTSWQTTYHFDVPDRDAPKGRRVVSFGPYTVTASADLVDLVEEQEVPATYLSTVTALLDTYADAAAASATAAAASAALAEDISNIGTPDALVETLIENPASLTATALAAAYVGQIGPAGLTVDVGTGGDFSTITDALQYLSARRAVFASTGVPVVVNLLSGFVMAEQIAIEGQDLGWITLTSDDATVTVSRAALTVKNGRWYSAWRVSNHSTAPRMNVKFEMDSTGTATERVGFYIRNRSTVIFGENSGFNSAGERNVDCTGNSAMVYDGSELTPPTFNDAGTIGIRLTNGSSCHLDGVIVTGCGQVNFSVEGGCKANLPDANLSGSLGIGLHAAGGSVVHADSVNLNDAVSHGVNVEGAVVHLSGGTANDCGGSGIHAIRGSVVNASRSGVTDFSATGCNIGVEAADSSVVDAYAATVDGATSHGVYATRGSQVTIGSGSADNCGGSALFADFASTISADVASATGAGGIGVRSEKGSTVDFYAGDASGSLGTGGLQAVDGGIINARSANARKGGADATTDAVVFRGGVINAHSLTGGISEPANAVTRNGVIYRDGIAAAYSAVVVATQADNEVANTTTDTALCTLATPVLPALAAGDRLRLHAEFDISNTTAGAVNYTFRIKLGATTLATSSALSVAAANVRYAHVDATFALVSANGQRLGGTFLVGTATASEIGFSTGAHEAVIRGVAVESLATSKDVVLSVEMGTADANAKATLKQASLELTRKV